MSRKSESLFNFCLFLILSEYAGVIPAAYGLESVPSVSSESSPQISFDWKSFDPNKFAQPNRLVPFPALTPKDAGYYGKFGSFPHDPTRSNILYGRGRDKLPTEIYAKAFDILLVKNRYFQVPAAGKTKQLPFPGEPVQVYGVSWYTPLIDQSYIANPVKVAPFDPNRVFYRKDDLWPFLIYGTPGQEVTIAGEKFLFPPAGQMSTVVFGADGRLKMDGLSNKESDESNTSDKGKSSQSGKSSGSDLASSKQSKSPSSASTGAKSQDSETIGTEKAAAEKAAAEKAAAEKSRCREYCC